MEKIRITFRDLVNNTIKQLLDEKSEKTKNKPLVSIYEIQMRIYRDHNFFITSQMIDKKMYKNHRLSIQK